MDDRTCAYAPCVNVFSPQRKDRRFCNQKCARLAWYFSNREHANLMNRRYVKANRERLNQRKAQWWRADPDRARVLAHRARLKRRYRLKAQFIEDVVLSVLVARDGGRCQLCGKTVRATTGERGPSIDHIVPLSLGGDHSYANTQLAHPVMQQVQERAGAQVRRTTSPDRLGVHTMWIEHHRVFNGRERVFIDHVNGELDDWRSENLELRLVTKPVCAGDFRRFWDIAF